MKHLYNSPDGKRLLIFCCILLLKLFIPIHIYCQDKDFKIKDWTLPLKACTQYLPLKGQSKSLASDNNNNLYFSSKEKFLRSFNFETKNLNWELNLGSNIISNILVSGEIIYVVTEDKIIDGKINLWSISSFTGITVWQKTLTSDTKNILLTNDNGDLGIYIKTELSIFRISDKNGDILWQINQLNSGNYNLLKSQLGDFESLNKDLAKIELPIYTSILQQNKTKTETPVILYETKENIITAEKAGKLSSFNKSNSKKLWDRKVGGEISNIQSVAKNQILVSSLDNFLYLVSEKNGKLIWKRRLPYRSSESLLIDNQIVLISSIGSSEIFIIDLKEGKVLNQIDLTDLKYSTGNPLAVDGTIAIPTNIGIFLYSQRSC